MKWKAKQRDKDEWSRHLALAPVRIDNMWHWLEVVEYQDVTNGFETWRNWREIPKADTKEQDGQIAGR